MEGGVDGGGRGVFINSPPSSLHHSPPYTQTHDICLVIGLFVVDRWIPSAGDGRNGSWMADDDGTTHNGGCQVNGPKVATRPPRSIQTHLPIPA